MVDERPPCGPSPPTVISILVRRGAGSATDEETDWAQIVEWYDELVRLNRAVAVGETHGPPAGLAELDPPLPRYTAVTAQLHERDSDLVTAARPYANTARSEPSLPERDRLMWQAARPNAELRR